MDGLHVKPNKQLIMTKEKLLEKQNVIYTIALDRIWDYLNSDQQNDMEWIWEEMENELNKLQNENTGKVLKRLFDQWGDDNSKVKQGLYRCYRLCFQSYWRRPCSNDEKK